MMQNSVKIAITGGICSGKSTVSDIIKKQGYGVISCDEIYAELLTDGNFIDMLANEFGNIKCGDRLDRAALSKIVFNDKAKLQKLNELTHPKIMQTAIERMQREGLNFCEVPLLFEGGFEKFFDNIIVVLRDKEARICELMQRAKIERKDALLRLNSQFNYDNGNYIKYYVIHNNDNLAKLEQNVLSLLENIKKDYI